MPLLTDYYRCEAFAPWLRQVFAQDAHSLEKLLGVIAVELDRPGNLVADSRDVSTADAFRGISRSLLSTQEPCRWLIEPVSDDLLYDKARDAVAAWRTDGLAVLLCALWGGGPGYTGGNESGNVRKEALRAARERLWTGMIAICPELLRILVLKGPNNDGCVRLVDDLVDYMLVAPESLVDWRLLGGTNPSGYPYQEEEDVDESDARQCEHHRPLVTVEHWRRKLGVQFLGRLLPGFRGQERGRIGRVAASLRPHFAQQFGGWDRDCEEAREFWQVLDDAIAAAQREQPELEGLWQKYEGVAVHRYRPPTAKPRIPRNRVPHPAGRIGDFASEKRFELWCSLCSDDAEYERAFAFPSDEQCNEIVEYARLKREWLRYATSAFGSSPDLLEDETRKRLREYCQREMTELRLMCRDAKVKGDDFVLRRIGLCCHLDHAVIDGLACFGGLWDAIRQVLLALRELPVPATEADLQTIFQGKDDDTCGFSPLAWLLPVLHRRFRSEQWRDEPLSNLRTEFARFCIDRMKTVREGSRRRAEATATGTEAPLKEPDAIWRIGYLRAVAELHAPELSSRDIGIVRRTADNDPDPRVKVESAKLYQIVRSSDYGQTPFSPRRMVLAALWQLRWSQRVALLGESSVDPQRAQSTKDREARETSGLSRDRWSKQANGDDGTVP